MGSLATPLLILVFAAGAAATWLAGVALSRTTDALDVRLGLGEELGGILLLAISGSLPEVAIIVSAAAQGNLDIAAGNLIGGIAAQTMVLVVCDAAAGRERPLTFLVGALTPVLEGLLVVLVVSGVLMGALPPPSTAIAGVVSPASVAIVAVWLVGVYVINRARKDPRWSVSMPGARRGRRHRREPHPERPHPFARSSTLRVSAIFIGACAVTLVAGVVLAMSGNALADRAGVNGVIFGATVLAAATALLEVSSGIAAVRLGDNARDRRRLRRRRVPGLPVPGGRLDRGHAGAALGRNAEQLARLTRNRVDRHLRDRRRRAAAALSRAPRARLATCCRRLRTRASGALRAAPLAGG